MTDAFRALVPTKASLTCLAPIPGQVKFDLNPTKIKMVRATEYGHRGNASPNAGVPSGASGGIFRRAPAPMLVIDRVVLLGRDTKERCDQLLNWMNPSGGLLGAVAGAAIRAISGGAVNLTTRPPVLTFSWGSPTEGFLYQVLLSKCDIAYTRFASDGSPIRAEVNMSLQQQPSFLSLLGTNPTSGGLPGRSAHTVTSGESLAGIATSAYGNPGRWRDIADRNGIDDPLRVRPGDRVYLPNAGELAGGA